MTTIAIIEDDTEIREGLQLYLRTRSDVRCTTAEGSIESFLACLDELADLDVIIMDIGLPGMSGISGIGVVKDRLPDVDIIMFTVYDDPNRIFQALCAGATGYLLKTTPFPKIVEAITNLQAGWAPMSPQIAQKIVEYYGTSSSRNAESPLTPRDKEIVIGLVDGLSYKMIADRLGVTIETIRHHIKNIYRKLHVNSKAEVITRSLRGEI